jgi:Na+/phosphate symporter
MSLLRQFLDTLVHSLRNLLPIVIVVGVFQFLILQQVPEGLGSMVLGLGIVVLGVALFLQGLEMGVFPIGKSLSDEFAAKGSLPWLMIFGFFMGFSAVIAEPALIAVAEQAETISEGRIDPLILRLLVAVRSAR